MPSADFLISLREKLLNRLSGSDPTWTLNPSTDPSLHSGLRLTTSQITPHHSEPMDRDPAEGLQNLLREVLSSGWADHGENIDYVALRASPLYDNFRDCTTKLRTFDPSTLPNRNARLAFWINLYNTLVLDAVIALGIQHSVMERHAGISFFHRAGYVVGGQRVSCDDIEHGILRANRGHPFYPGRQFHSSDPRLKWVIEPFDARIHFALNCASRSCPPIRAYSAENLDSQLELATRSYLAVDVQIMPEENALYLSSIFKWFASDFVGHDGIIEFVLSHLSEGRELVWLSQERDRVSFRYKPYDWNLNGRV
jgi:Protein of unknown function, DUF547